MNFINFFVFFPGRSKSKGSENQADSTDLGERSEEWEAPAADLECLVHGKEFERWSRHRNEPG